MDRKAYLAKLRSQNKRERSFASLGLACSGRDMAIAFGLYLAAVVLCLFLRNIDLHQDTTYVAVIFLLDVFLTAYWTNGYILGILTAVAGVFSVDYIFTYPYWHISFTLTGFPLTFLVMMTISVLTAAVTSRAKQTEAVRREAEREKMYADLLRAVSHDIRTPLTGIVGATNVLLEQDGELTAEQRQQLLRSTNEDAQWLIRIVAGAHGSAAHRAGAGEPHGKRRDPRRHQPHRRNAGAGGGERGVHRVRQRQGHPSAPFEQVI